MSDERAQQTTPAIQRHPATNGRLAVRVDGEWSPAQVWEVRNGRVQKVREKEVLRT
jgi:hypothetical protein